MKRTLARLSATWTRPLPAGKSPAYDAALNFLALDKSQKLKQLATVPVTDLEEIERLSILALVNDPEVRFLALNNSGDMSLPVYRHLAERKFRKEGTLAILNQRITQMNVIPDILPNILAIAELELNEGVEPGSYLKPAETKEGLTLKANVYHKEEKLYTLLMVDPDVPDEANHSFTTYAHWLIPNIPLSSTLSTISAPALLPFIPPHPQQGTPYHRYTILLLAQPNGSDGKIVKLEYELGEREGFNTREFVEKHGLVAEGVTFFRQVWDKDVASIYKEIYGVEEPRFGREKKVDYYLGEDGERRAKYDLE